MSKASIKAALAALLPDNTRLRISAHRSANDAMVDAFYEPEGIPKPYTGNTAPDGYHLFDGGEISRIANPLLFALWGTKYGVGNGTTTFNVPNWPEGTMPIQCGEHFPLGSKGGETAHVLTDEENGPHTHGVRKSNDSNGTKLHVQMDTDDTVDGDGIKYTIDGTVNGTPIVAPSGLGTAHNNMSPYFACNWIFKLQ